MNSVTANNVPPMNRATAKNGTLIRAKLIPAARIATNSLPRARLVSVYRSASNSAIGSTVLISSGVRRK